MEKDEKKASPINYNPQEHLMTLRYLFNTILTMDDYFYILTALTTWKKNANKSLSSNLYLPTIYWK